MNVRTVFGSLALAAFVFVTLFGLLAFASPHHDMGCPFVPGTTAVCNAEFAHVSHWNSALTFLVTELVLLSAIVLVRIRSTFLTAYISRVGVRLRHALPERPTLLQELFSQGILHPKVPYSA